MTSQTTKDTKNRKLRSSIILFFLLISSYYVWVFPEVYSQDVDVAAHWEMDEVSWGGVEDEVRDSSGNGNNGTAVNGANTTADAKSGRGGFFNGTSYVRIPNSESLTISGNELTLEAWVKWNADPGEWAKKKIDKKKNSRAQIINKNGDKEWRIQHSENNRYFEFSIKTTSHRKYVRSSTSPEQGVWYHIACVYDGESISIYVNGTRENSKSLSGNVVTSSSDINIGRSTKGDRYFNGTIDELRVYIRALSSSEIRTHFEGTEPTELSITKIGPADAIVGSVMTFTGTLSNEGNSTAFNMVLVDQLPDGMTFVSSSHAATYDEVNNTVTWFLGNLSRGAAIPEWITVQISPSLPSDTVLTNTFNVTWEDEFGTTFGPSNATVTTTIHALPEIILEKEGPDEALRNQTFTYNITVSNEGSLAAENVTLYDTLPNNLSYVNSTPTHTTYDPATSNITWNLGTVEGEASTTVNVTVTVDSDVPNGGELLNTVNATWTYGSTPYGPATAYSSTTVYTQPQIITSIEGPAEAVVNSTITLSGFLQNVGGSPAYDGVLLCHLPPGFTYNDSEHPCTYYPGNNTIKRNILPQQVLPGIPPVWGWITVDVSPTIPDGTVLTSLFNATWKDFLGNPYGPTYASVDTIIHTRSLLNVTITGPDRANQGETVTYNITVMNIGQVETTDVILNHHIPMGFSYIDSSNGTHDSGIIRWEVGSLSQGESALLTVNVKVDYMAFLGDRIFINIATTSWADEHAPFYGPKGDTVETTVQGVWVVTSATLMGDVLLSPDDGPFSHLEAVPENTLPLSGKPSLIFPYGFFDLSIIDLTPGETVTITFTFPANLSTDTQYWKYGPTPTFTTDHWYQIPVGDNDGDNVITVNITDGGLGDDDLTANGEIVDQGGPGTPAPIPVGGKIFLVDKLAVLKPYIGTVLFIVLAVASIIKRTSCTYTSTRHGTRHISQLPDHQTPRALDEQPLSSIVLLSRLEKPLKLY